MHKTSSNGIKEFVLRLSTLQLINKNKCLKLKLQNCIELQLLPKLGNLFSEIGKKVTSIEEASL